MEQPLPQCQSTNSVPRAFFPRVAIGCRLSLKIDRNLLPFWAGGLSIATWYDTTWIGGTVSGEYLYRSVVINYSHTYENSRMSVYCFDFDRLSDGIGSTQGDLSCHDIYVCITISMLRRQQRAARSFKYCCRPSVRPLTPISRDAISPCLLDEF